MVLSVAMADLLLPESDQASVPQFTHLDSPLPFPIAPFADVNPDDFANVIPVDLNSVISTPIVQTDQFRPGKSPFKIDHPSLDSRIAQTLSKDIETGSSVQPATLGVNLETDRGHSDPSCNPVSRNAGKKTRRQHCGAPRTSQTDYSPNLASAQFLEIAPTQDGTHPKGALTPEEVERNHRIYKADRKKMIELFSDLLNPLWDSTAHADAACARTNSKRRTALCCLGGPPLSQPASLPLPRSRPQKRAETTVVNMQNCQRFLAARPFCIELGTTCQFCCQEFDHKTGNLWGWMGVDCVQMNLNFEISSLSSPAPDLTRSGMVG